MLVRSLIFIAIIFSTNGLPYSPQTKTPYTAYQNSEQKSIFQIPEQPEVIFQPPEQQHVIFQTPEQQEVIFQPEQDGVIFQNSRQKMIFENPKQDTNQNQAYRGHFASDGLKFAEQDADFIISCIGLNRICVNKKDCVNGYIHSSKSTTYSSSIKTQQCRVHDQVCCTITKEFERKLKTSSKNVKDNSNNINYQTEQSSINYNQVAVTKERNEPNIFGSSMQSAFAIPTHVQLGCAAALICVEEKFCTMDGMISPEPVILSEKQLLRRVPMSSCKNPDNGIIGKCCRDPNYVDPWPTGNLPANYSGGFDEQGFPTFMNIVKVKLPNIPAKTTKIPAINRNVEYSKEVEPVLIPENSDISTKKVFLVPPNTGIDDRSGFNTPKTRSRCGIRNKVLKQSQETDSKTVFAEIPWQAMVLHLKERKILCSGVLIGNQDVLTAANCIYGLLPEDILIKLGEWKLGYELKHEEPLPFQIINVSSISIHPYYEGKPGEYDLAMLHLENPITFDRHISPICLPDSKHLLQNNKLCIATGWGKSILQAHYAGAIMHAISMNILSRERCKDVLLLSTNLGINVTNGTICAAPKEEKDNICDTDVGGPLACQNEHGAYELSGIYSQDTGCYPSNQVAVFASLDVAWVKKIISNSAVDGNKINIKYDANNENSASSDYRKSTLVTDNQYLPPH
ncbi:uncharacterized protein LOC117212680 [Bombus bifarius]|uniref:Uncharacterized protein LOC117212680 n=1 Tax=Bombus bifarius TaxID=103933 RepID=A0A6P8NFZ1_9HYME|nr:uncharacterized protein LOC117212680 [Bombus bifarius]XP_033313523.1 uncharacterized protein LOC117212680 [Bombus bifarius]